MNKKLLCLAVGLCALHDASAALPVQQRITGIVQSVDTKKHTLILNSPRQMPPMEFTIVEGRTRLRCEGTPAQIGQIKPGQAVRIYYREELGKNVAIDIAVNHLDQPAGGGITQP